jgi:hypothetical protein
LGGVFIFLQKTRLEYIIECFERAFSGYELYIVDGEDLIDRLVENYRHHLETSQMEVAQAETPDGKDEATSSVIHYQGCISHLLKERPRLLARYRDTGRYALGDPRSFVLRYHRLLAKAA